MGVSMYRQHATEAESSDSHRTGFGKHTRPVVVMSTPPWEAKHVDHMSVVATHVVGCGFVPWLGHTKDLYIFIWFIVFSVINAVQPDCGKERVMCGTVYEDMHSKDILGLITRVGYCIPALDACYSSL